MNPLDSDLWSRGLTWSQYRSRITKNTEVFDEVLAAPAYTDADLDFLRRLPPQRVVAIGEDWCPDVFHTLPTWVRLADELAGWELRIYPRDTYPGLMNDFLYNGRAQRIPVYAFYDARGYLQTWWSGRSAAAQSAFDSWLGGQVYADLDPDRRAELGQRFAEGYRREFRRRNFEEMLTQLGAFFHVARGDA